MDALALRKLADRAIRRDRRLRRTVTLQIHLYLIAAVRDLIVAIQDKLVFLFVALQGRNYLTTPALSSLVSACFIQGNRDNLTVRILNI